MKSKSFLKILTVLSASIALVGCTKAPEVTVVEEPEVVEEVVVDNSYYDEEFINVFASAIEYRQELGERISHALTTTDVLQKELDRHPDYSTMNFQDEVLKTYAVHYREALANQLAYWKSSSKKDKDWEGYREADLDKAIKAWLTQVDAVNALVREYELPIPDELAEEYSLESYFWGSGLYTPSLLGVNNTGILFDDMKQESKFDDKSANSTVKLTIKNLTKYDLTGIHIYVYHLTKGGYVLEKEIPVGIWDIDSEIVKEYEVHEKYVEKDHLYDAGSGLSLSLFPNRLKVY